MKLKLTIPDYITISHYQQLGNLEHLSELDKAIKVISLIADISEDDIKKWNVNDIQIVSKDITAFSKTEPLFYPIFEWNGMLFGYQNINNMSLAEVVDLQNLCKEPMNNLHEIMAILYRPITKHKLKDIGWNIVNKIKIANNKSNNIFKSYELEPYNNKDRYENGLLMKAMPISFAQGALDFFLATYSEYINNMIPSSTAKQLKMRDKITTMNLNHLANIGVGLQQSILYPNQVYSISQEKTILLT
jgi:hypothetical protein